MHKIFNTFINRTEIINLLYQFQFYNQDNTFFNNLDYKVEESTQTIYNDIISNILEIDDIIDTNLYNYSLSRLNLVDLSIIRLAVFEMLYTDMPSEVTINEAINLTKDLSDLDDEKQHKFTNKLLDNIKKAIISE